MYITKAVRLQMRRAHCVLASFAAWICRGRVQTVAQDPWHLGAVDSLLQSFTDAFVALTRSTKTERA